MIFHQCSDLKEQAFRVTERKGKFETSKTETSKKICKRGTNWYKIILMFCKLNLVYINSSACSLLCILVCNVKILDYFYIPEAGYMVHE